LDQNASIKRKAQDLIKKGAYADATAHYEKLAEAGDLQSYDYVVLGDLLIRCGRRVEAVERYREALNSYAEAGLSRNAIALAKKVHRLAPKLYFVHRRLGDLYLAEGLEGEACRHYTEYLDRVDREAEGIQDELQHVCEQLLEIDLPSISIVERVVAVARDAGFGDAIAGGILGQAQRALARGDADSHTKLQGLARELSPRGGGQETPPAHPALPANALFDPSAVDFPEEPAEQPAVLSLEGFTFDALHSVNLDPPTPVAAFESDDADAAFESDETDAAIDGSTPVFSLDEVSDIPVDADRPVEMEPRASEPGMSVAEDVEIVLEHDDDPDNLRTRAMEFLEKGDIARAQRELVRAARAYFQGGRSREAEELYRKVMHLDPNHLDALRGLVELAYINGERGKMAHWGTELGDVLLAREMYADAKIQFERVLAFDPDNVKARARVNRLNTIAGVNDANFGELVPDAGEVQGAQVTVKDEPTGTQTAFDLSRILDEFKTAMTDQIEVDDGKSHFDLGLTYKEMGLLPEAVSEFEQAAAAEADRSRSLEMLGECYLLLDRHEESLRVLSEIVDAADGDGQARVHMQLGRAYEGMGAWDQAEEEYYRALELDENLEEAVERLERLEERRERGVA
jgi:tetratricopeptide (TPR) repeat protein